MATITEIKHKVDLLDQSKFQELTDAIIKLENTSSSIISYGLNKKGRTIKGSPDSFLLLPESTIFVEASIQQSKLYDKFRSDIKKCLSISSKTLKKIILSYTGRLSIEEIEQLQDLLPDNITLEILGIDEIAHRIYVRYQHLASDYLGLPIDTGQILPIEIFLNTVDKNKYSAPLNVDFMYRKEDISGIRELMDNLDYIILTGSPGCGKTRLALQILREEKKRISYVIKNKNTPIHEDLSRYFQQNKKYLVLIDDANQLSQFKSMIEFFSTFFFPGDIKVIISVRDYAKNVVTSQLENIPYKEIKLMPFTKEEIANIIKNNLKILNQNYLEQISTVSKGNARIAYLIGLVALKENNLSSIHNNEETMTIFYKTVVEMIQMDKKYIVTFGIISFFGKMKLDNNNQLEKILNLANIAIDDFMDAIKFLHSNEFIDIYNDSIVMISDETMGNYIFYYTFIEKKILNISAFIKAYYNSHLKRVVSIINASLSMFLDTSLSIFKEAALKIFEELLSISKDDAIEFLSHFCLLFELDAVMFLKDHIDKIENKENLYSIDMKINYSKESIHNQILVALNLLSRGTYFKEVFEILITLLNKEGFYIKEIVATIYQSFRMSKYTFSNNFEVQQNILHELSLKPKEENYLKLIQILLNNYICLGFEETFFEGKTMEFYRFVHNEETYNYKFREKLWRFAREYLSSEEKVVIINTFVNFPMIYEATEKIIENELFLIMDNLYEVIYETPSISSRLNSISKHYSITNDKLEQLMNSDSLYIYKLIHKKLHKYKDNYDDFNKRNNDSIISYAKNFEEKNFQPLIKCIEIHSSDDYEVTESLLTIILNVSDEHFLKLLDYFMSKDSKHLTYPGNIIERIEKLGINFLDFMHKYRNFSNKQNWMLQYYERINASEINQNVLNDFLTFLENYEVLRSYRYIRVEELIKYYKFDNTFYVQYANIALNKDSVTFRSFIGLLFNEHLTNPRDLYLLLNKNIDLYEKLYFKNFLTYDSFDYKFLYLKFISSIDVNAIYKFINIVLRDSRLRYQELTLDFVWGMEKNEIIVNKIIDIIVDYRKNSMISYLSNSPLKLLKNDNNITIYVELLKKRIKETFDKSEISEISEFALSLNGIKLELFETFINNNDNFELFKNYKIIPSSRSWSGSAIPVINSEIGEINSLLDLIPHNTKYLKHRKYLQSLIDSKVQERKWWEEKEIFDEF